MMIMLKNKVNKNSNTSLIVLIRLLDLRQEIVGKQEIINNK
jgi:hypothetical protein